MDEVEVCLKNIDDHGRIVDTSDFYADGPPAHAFDEIAGEVAKRLSEGETAFDLTVTAYTGEPEKGGERT